MADTLLLIDKQLQVRIGRGILQFLNNITEHLEEDFVISFVHGILTLNIVSWCSINIPSAVPEISLKYK